MALLPFSTFTRSDRSFSCVPFVRTYVLATIAGRYVRYKPHMKGTCVMRKLITGLLATLTIVFAMSSSALAQETVEKDLNNHPTCGEPETLTLVPNPGGWTDVYNADGVICAQVAAEQPAQPTVPESSPTTEELPRTGSAATALAIIAGVSLMFFGLVMKRFGRLRLDA